MSRRRKRLSPAEIEANAVAQRDVKPESWGQTPEAWRRTWAVVP